MGISNNSSINTNDTLFFIKLFIVLEIILINLLLACFIANKAKNKGHSYGCWFILGILFGLLALLALYVALSAKKEGLHFKLWAFFGLILGVGSFVMLQTGIIAKRRGYEFFIFCLLGAFFGLPALIVACFLPSSIKEATVENDGSKHKQEEPKSESAFSKSCSVKYTPSKTTTPKPKSSGWTCPNCGMVNNINAKNCINCFTEKN